MELKQTDTFIELDIIVDGVTVGNAEIEPNKSELSRLVIFEPYRNKGYGIQAVKMLVKTYNLDNLWVRSDNAAAIHVYEKCGFVKHGETMFQMKLESAITWQEGCGDRERCIYKP